MLPPVRNIVLINETSFCIRKTNIIFGLAHFHNIDQNVWWICIRKWRMLNFECRLFFIQKCMLTMNSERLYSASFPRKKESNLFSSSTKHLHVHCSVCCFFLFGMKNALFAIGSELIVQNAWKMVMVMVERKWVYAVLKICYFAIENLQKHAHIIIQSQWYMYYVLHYYNKYSKNTGHSISHRWNCNSYVSNTYNFTEFSATE